METESIHLEAWIIRQDKQPLEEKDHDRAIDVIIEALEMNGLLMSAASHLEKEYVDCQVSMSKDRLHLWTEVKQDGT